MMGREIRRVPPGWEHPRDDDGEYKAMYDVDFKTAAEEWNKNNILWMKGEHPDQEKDYAMKNKYYWEWGGDPPDPESYRPEFKEEPTHYQIYETVSEGSPISPVFEKEEDMKIWLIGKGHSEKSADGFIKDKWAPSFVMLRNEQGCKIKSGIDAHDMLEKDEE